MKEFITACPRNCYSTCSLKVVVDNDKVINVTPLSTNRATPMGVCLKGLSYVERANSKHRILYPHKKNKDGKFTRITWDEALTIIAEKLTTLKKDYGSQSVLFYAASGMSGLLNEISGKFWRQIYGGVT
ncbi:MAG: molybdopterin-dependent oxidoreductase, partial [Caedimonadaceae bacterium]